MTAILSHALAGPFPMLRAAELPLDLADHWVGIRSAFGLLVLMADLVVWSCILGGGS